MSITFLDEGKAEAKSWIHETLQKRLFFEGRRAEAQAIQTYTVLFPKTEGEQRHQP